MLDDELLGTGGSYEESYRDYEIFIGRNADRWRGGFEWSVCREDAELEAGLAFTVDDALSEARQAVDAIAKNTM